MRLTRRTLWLLKKLTPFAVSILNILQGKGKVDSVQGIVILTDVAQQWQKHLVLLPSLLPATPPKVLLQRLRMRRYSRGDF